MGIPIDDEPLEPTDEEPVTEEAAPEGDTVDLEAPGPDAADQQRELGPGWRIGRRSTDPEAPDADKLDQATGVPLDDDAENWRR